MFSITFRPDGPDRIAIVFPYSAAAVSIIRTQPGVSFDRSRTLWTAPLENFAAIRKALKDFICKVEGLNDVAMGVDDLVSREVDVSSVEATLAGYKFKTTPYQHQRNAVALAVKAERFGLFMEMGTGKTKSAIDWASLLMERGLIGGALIVCPKAVVLNWEREIAVHSPLPAVKRMVASIRGTAKQKEKAFNEGGRIANFFVTNYATILSDLDFAGLVHRKGLAIILDESTNIKTPTAKTTKAVHALKDLARFKLILTGSPITQGPLDAFSQFGFLDSKITGHHNFFSFKAEYAIMGGFQAREVVGYKNLERLTSRLKDHNYRVLKKDCLDLPEKLYQTIEVEAGPKQREAYNSMRDESIVELGEFTVSAPVTLTRMLRLQQITAGFLPKLDEFGKEIGTIEFESPKLDAAEELVEQAIEGGQKVIVWCRFIREIEALEKRLAGHGVVTYYGAVSDDQRQANVDAFQTNPGVKVFIGQIQTGGIAITLTAASVEIYVTNTFALVDRLQSEDRAHRIGQKRNVTIIDLVVKGTLDVYVLKTLRDKKSLADVITGDNLREVMGNA